MRVLRVRRKELQYTVKSRKFKGVAQGMTRGNARTADTWRPARPPGSTPNRPPEPQPGESREVVLLPGFPRLAGPREAAGHRETASNRPSGTKPSADMLFVSPCPASAARGRHRFGIVKRREALQAGMRNARVQPIRHGSVRHCRGTCRTTRFVDTHPARGESAFLPVESVLIILMFDA